MNINSSPQSYKLLALGQIFLYIGAFFGALSLVMVALPLHSFSWPLTLCTAAITLVAMLISVISLSLLGSKRNNQFLFD